MGTSLEPGGAAVRVDLAREEVAELFGNSNLPRIMQVVAKEPSREFAVTELMQLAGLTSNEGTTRAVEALLKASWIRERRAGRGRLLRVNEEILTLPPNPYLQIPEAFREVTRHVAKHLLARSGAEVWKILLFGGLAVGRGDRQSDLDVFVVTPSPRPVRLEANRLVDELRTAGFRGQRYDLHVFVETPGGLRKMRADPGLPRLLSTAIALWDDPRHPLEPMLPGAPE